MFYFLLPWQRVSIFLYNVCRKDVPLMLSFYSNPSLHLIGQNLIIWFQSRQDLQFFFSQGYYCNGNASNQ